MHPILSHYNQAHILITQFRLITMGLIGHTKNYHVLNIFIYFTCFVFKAGEKIKHRHNSEKGPTKDHRPETTIVDLLVSHYIMLSATIVLNKNFITEKI